MLTSEKKRVEEILSYMPPDDRAVIAPYVQQPRTYTDGPPRSTVFKELLAIKAECRVSHLAALIKVHGVPTDFPQCLVILPDMYWEYPTSFLFRDDHAVFVDAALTGPVFPLAWSDTSGCMDRKKRAYIHESPLQYTTRLRTYIMDSGLPSVLCKPDQDSDLEQVLVVPLILARRSFRVLGKHNKKAAATAPFENSPLQRSYQAFMVGLTIGAAAAAPVLVALRDWLYSS